MYSPVKNIIGYALIDGKKVRYNARSDNSLKEAKEFYENHNFKYIGSSKIIYQDGKETILDKETHLFR